MQFQILLHSHIQNPKHYRTEMKKMVQLIKPWYDAGLVSIFNFRLPHPISRAGGGTHFRGQPQWTIQCLYLAKAYGDQFTLNTDADEFLVFHNGLSISHNLKYKYYKDISNRCWVVFDAYNVWKLTNPNEPYLVPRFSEIFIHSGFISQTCKSLWNNKYLWSAEVHAGGACNISNTFGFDWTQFINHYKGFGISRWTHRANPYKLVRVMHVRWEASIRHYRNARYLRHPWEPDEYSYDDSCVLHGIIWKSIKREFDRMGWKNVTYNDYNTKYDILESERYIEIFGVGNSMEKIIGNDSFLAEMPIYKEHAQVIPHYKSLTCNNTQN